MFTVANTLVVGMTVYGTMTCSATPNASARLGSLQMKNSVFGTRYFKYISVGIGKISQSGAVTCVIGTKMIREYRT
jgi:hypothetical protein